MRDAEATNAGHVTSEMFVTGYQSIGGSLKRGNEVRLFLHFRKYLDVYGMPNTHSADHAFIGLIDFYRLSPFPSDFRCPKS